jgi:hypothetical protein
VVKIDTLALSLRELAAYDQASAVVLTALGYVLEVPVPALDIRTCKFDIDNTHYSAQVTLYQSTVILTAFLSAPDGEKRKATEAAVNVLLGALSLQIDSAFNGLANLLGNPGQASAVEVALKPLVNIAPVGCCVYDGGYIAGVTQSVCDHYQPTYWGPSEECPPRVRANPE